MANTLRHGSGAATAGDHIEHSIARLMQGTVITAATIDDAEQSMLGAPQAACPVIHRFGPDMYIREVAIDADTFAIGHYHRFAQMNIFLKGRVTVIQGDGTLAELVAPMCFVGPPGRKVGYVHEDVVWLNVYATSETDIDKLEATFLIKSAAWELNHEQQRALDILRRQADRDDFASAISKLGLSHEIVRAQSESAADQIPFPPGAYKVKVSTSAIEGRGLFATADISAGEVIASARIGGMRTPAGRFTNHACAPNAQMRLTNLRGDICLVAIQAIKGSCGGADGEEITIDYRDAVALNHSSYYRDALCQE